MRFAWVTAMKDWRSHRRNPLELLMWIGIPLVIGLLIVLAFGGEGGPKPQIHLLVADEDASFVSALLMGAMQQRVEDGMIVAEEVQSEDGRRRMDNGDATALIIIPDGFGDAFLQEQATTLQLVTNPSQRFLPGIVEEGLSMLADGTFYLHRMIGDELKTIALGPPVGASTFPNSDISALGIKINTLMGGLDSYLSPLLIQLETSTDKTEQGGDDDPPLAFLLISTIMFMALLFMAQGLSEDIWTERTQHTLRRIVCSPQPVALFLAGKLLGAAGLFFVVALVALGIGYTYIGVNPVSLPLALVWATFSGTMLMTLMTTLQLFCSTRRAGNIFTMAVMFPLMMIGGSFFPFEAMPDWMAAIGKLTPNGWALQQLKNIILQRTDPMTLLIVFAALLSMVAVLFAVCAQRLRRGFAQG